MTVTVLASCVAYYPPEVNSSLVTVGVECACGIGLPPPPILWTDSFVVPGLPAGTATVEFIDNLAIPPVPIYSFEVAVGSPIEVPAIDRRGAVLLTVLIALSGVALLKSRR